MNRVKLSAAGKTFATRERARELDASFGANEPMELDLSDVTASPSFLAELLVLSAQRSGRVIVIGANQHLADMAEGLARKLELGGVEVSRGQLVGG